MKRVICKSGIEGWQCRLKKNYGSFGEFKGYCEVQGLHTRLGFKTPAAAWKANPLIQGSVIPDDYRVVPGKQKPIKPISISSNRYVNNFDCAVCPVCQSSDISSDHVDMDGSIGTANVECKTCGSYWTDIVHVTSYSNLNENMTLDQLGEVLEKAKAQKENPLG